MKGYLIVVGALVVTVSLIGGAIYLSGSYEQYQRRLQALNAPAGSPMTVMDEAKWQFAKVVGTSVLAGGIILGSMLMGLGWIGKTLEEIRDAMVMETSEPEKS
ncbi:MAG TPA: hypothetical protein VII12_16025 [Thermoanaerobaculia bacterium]|jgi:hypothetical protein